MVTLKDTALIHNTAAEWKKKFGRQLPLPSLTVWVAAIGGTFVGVQVRWTTHLADNSLRVVLATGEEVDITAQLTIDVDAMTATGDIDTGSVGVQVVRASGEFLARLVPTRSVILSATGSAYLPY